MKLQLLRADARRVLLRHADEGRALSERLFDQKQLPIQPHVDSDPSTRILEEPIDDIKRLSHIVWLDNPQLSGLTGDEVMQHMGGILSEPYKAGGAGGGG